MNLIDNLSYDNMSKKVTQRIIDLIKNKPNCNICLATGYSVKLVYENLIEVINNEKIDTSTVTFTKLDEWCNVNSDDSCTCEYYLKTQFLDHINYKNFISFNSEASDYENEVLRVRNLLMNNKIDLCLLGLGMDGHLGLNEPTDELDPYAHISKLHAKTMTHEMLSGKKVEFGMTLGLKEILDSNNVILIITGKNKEWAKSTFLNMKITTTCPSTFLWLKDNLEVFITT